MKILLSALLLIVAPLTAFASDREPGQNSIIGVWKVVEIATDYGSAPDIGPKTSQVEPNLHPLPSQIIFTNSHYSMIWMPGKEAMTAFAIRWQPTDEEKLRRFGEIVMNTGTYELRDNLLTVHPRLARVPEFMGGRMVYDCKWSGDHLILTLIDEYTFDGVKAPWAGESSGHIHLILARLDDRRKQG